MSLVDYYALKKDAEEKEILQKRVEELEWELTRVKKFNENLKANWKGQMDDAIKAKLQTVRELAETVDGVPETADKKICEFLPTVWPFIKAKAREVLEALK